MLLEDKVAIITGGARGIGKAIAEKFIEEGCSVVLADINEDRAKETAAEISAKGGKVLAIKCDHTQSRQVQEMVDKTISEFGKIDILVNCAGGGSPTPSVVDCTEEEWHKALNLNLTGPFLCSKYVVPHMKERKSGSIINFSSAAAIAPNSMRPAYTAAKAGVIGLTYSMALELAAFNIRVNAIEPDIVRTEFYGPPGPERDARLENLGKYMLMGRITEPEEIAGVVLFLASGLSSYVTGIDMYIGGKYPPGSTAPAK